VRAASELHSVIDMFGDDAAKVRVVMHTLRVSLVS
jgi:hypothetical protein